MNAIIKGDPAWGAAIADGVNAVQGGVRMPDIEKVIKWLEICIKCCDDSCPYKKECESKGGFIEPMSDALALLKAHKTKYYEDYGVVPVSVEEALTMCQKEQGAKQCEIHD